MKKVICIAYVLCALGVYADDCSNAYKAGLDLYKNGKYTEAQQKFIAVEEECHGYSDVYGMLRACNKKLNEKQNQQAAQIASLKNENQQLVKAKENATSEGSTTGQLLSNATAQLKNVRQSLKAANDTIALLRADTLALHSVLSDLVKKNVILSSELEECKGNASVGNDKNRALKNELKNAKKEAEELAKKNDQLQKEIDDLKAQTAPNDSKKTGKHKNSKK